MYLILRDRRRTLGHRVDWGKELGAGGRQVMDMACPLDFPFECFGNLADSDPPEEVLNAMGEHYQEALGCCLKAHY